MLGLGKLVWARRVAMWAVILLALSIGGAAAADESTEQRAARLINGVLTYSGEDLQTQIEQVAKLHEAAIPAIEAAMARADDEQRLRLTRVLGGIGGDASTDLLVKALAQTAFPHSASDAIFRLENRPIRRPLTSEELGALTDAIAKKNIAGAGLASRVLGKCMRVPVEVRLEPMVARFKRELTSPTKLAPMLGSYLSPTAYVRNQFLLAFSYIGKPAIPILQRERQAASKDVGNWWVIALGFVGDASVADDLKSIIDAEPDKYIRMLAVKAYGESAQEYAVPLLESLLTDTTQSDYTDCTGRKYQIIRGAAQSALFTLKQNRAGEELAKLLTPYMGGVAGGKIQTIESRQLLGFDPNVALPQFEAYEKDPNASVRRLAYSFEWQYTIGGPPGEWHRRTTVERMAKALSDPALEVRTEVRQLLATLDSEDFTDYAKDAIRRLLKDKPNPDGGVILLTGVAQIRDQKPYLRGLIAQQHPASLQARLALARMGDKEQIAECIRLAKAEPDLVRRASVLPHQLAYTRQPEVIPVLNEYLLSDKRLPSVKDGVPGIRCCEYALWVLARTLEGFPVADKGTVGYSQEQIDTARQWMKTQTKFEFKERLSVRPRL